MIANSSVACVIVLWQRIVLACVRSRALLFCRKELLLAETQCRRFEYNILEKVDEITLDLDLDYFHSVYKCLKDLNKEINENKQFLDDIRVHCSDDEKINFIKKFIEVLNNTDYGQILEYNDP